MRVLVIVPSYPYPGYRFSGIFNEKSVHALKTLCDGVEVLAPRPYVPPLVSFCVPRWKAYATVPTYENRDGISVHRPKSPVVPHVAQAFWADEGSFLWCRNTVRKMHARARFGMIISFDLVGAGGLAWRVGRDLQIPASGWATGGDVRHAPGSSHARIVTRALKNLDMVFYQTQELLENAAHLMDVPVNCLLPDRHLVLPRGIPEPPILPRREIRQRVRRDLGIKDEQVFVLSVGRISREKGAFELIEAVSLAANEDRRITCVMLGANPAFDETSSVQCHLDKSPLLRQVIKIVPACDSDKVWEFLAAADIFAFTSHNEGMPNSLLEAMAVGLPAVAFSIPAVLELESKTGALVVIPAFEPARFAKAILRLAASATERTRFGEIGRRTVLNRFMIKNNMEIALNRMALKMREEKGASMRDDKAPSDPSRC